MPDLKLNLDLSKLRSMGAGIVQIPKTALRALHIDNIKWAEGVKKIIASKFSEMMKKDTDNITISTQTVLQAFLRSPEAERIFVQSRLNVDGPMDKWQRPVKSIEDYIGTETPYHLQQQYLWNQKIPYFLRESFGPFTDAGGDPKTSTADGGGSRIKKGQKEAIARRIADDAVRSGVNEQKRDLSRHWEEQIISALTSIPFVNISKRDVQLMYLNPEDAIKVRSGVGKNKVEIVASHKGTFEVRAVRLNGQWLVPLITRRKTPEEMGVTPPTKSLNELVQVNPILDQYIKANDPIYINTAFTRSTDYALKKAMGDLKSKFKAGTFEEVKKLLRSHGAM